MLVRDEKQHLAARDRSLGSEAAALREIGGLDVDHEAFGLGSPSEQLAASSVAAVPPNPPNDVTKIFDPNHAEQLRDTLTEWLKERDQLVGEGGPELNQGS